MRKVYKTIEEAMAVIEKYKKKKGTVLVRHREDGLYEIVDLKYL